MALLLALAPTPLPQAGEGLVSRARMTKPITIPAKAYARRRKQLMRMAGNDAILVLPAAPERIRSRDTHYPYRQDSDLLYLTGFPEPEAVLVLVPGRKHGEVAPVLPRARSRARRLGRPALRPRRRGRSVRPGRCLSDHRPRRHPAGPARRPLARVLPLRPRPGIRPQADRLAQPRARDGASRRAAAARVPRTGPPARRAAPVQGPRRTADDAARRRHQRARARSGDARGATGRARIPTAGRSRTRVPPARGRVRRTAASSAQVPMPACCTTAPTAQ